VKAQQAREGGERRPDPRTRQKKLAQPAGIRHMRPGDDAVKIDLGDKAIQARLKGSWKQLRKHEIGQIMVKLIDESPFGQ
jgi:hypothetical protein